MRLIFSLLFTAIFLAQFDSLATDDSFSPIEEENVVACYLTGPIGFKIRFFYFRPEKFPHRGTSEHVFAGTRKDHPERIFQFYFEIYEGTEKTLMIRGAEFGRKQENGELDSQFEFQMALSQAQNGGNIHIHQWIDREEEKEFELFCKEILLSEVKIAEKWSF